jgi:hypothetical protein
MFVLVLIIENWMGELYSEYSTSGWFSVHSTYYYCTVPNMVIPGKNGLCLC